MATQPYLKKIRTDDVPALSPEGEIYTVKKEITVFISGNEDFTFWFTHLTAVIKGINQISDLKLLYWISTSISHNEGIICLNKIFKDKIQKEICISQTSINRSIASLKAFGVLIPYPGAKRSAFFYVNPTFLWKGDKVKRLKQQEFILRMMKNSNLPDREKKMSEDIERYKKVAYNGQEVEQLYDFSKIEAA